MVGISCWCWTVVITGLTIKWSNGWIKSRGYRKWSNGRTLKIHGIIWSQLISTTCLISVTLSSYLLITWALNSIVSRNNDDYKWAINPESKSWFNEIIIAVRAQNATWLIHAEWISFTIKYKIFASISSWATDYVWAIKVK